MKILVSHDDGIFSPGIRALALALSEVADEVLMVAPDVEQSASGHAITIRRPLRYKRTRLDDLPENVSAFRVDGTPGGLCGAGRSQRGRAGRDCVGHQPGLEPWLRRDPLRYGGGGNGGDDDADSVGRPFRCGWGTESLTSATPPTSLKRWCPRVAENGLPERTLLNVNFPVGAPKGVRLARQSTHNWQDTVVKRDDPGGTPYYWITGEPVGLRGGRHRLCTVVTGGYAAVTPLAPRHDPRQLL